MLRKTMIVLAAAVALTGGLSADAFALGGHGGGGGGGHAGGFGGGAHIGGTFGGAHIGGAHIGGGLGRGHFSGGSFARPRFAGPHGHVAHDRGFGRRLLFGPGYYDYGCGYRYPYDTGYSCYTPED